MLLISELKAFLLTPLCCLVGFLGFTAAVAPQVSYGVQPIIQQPIIQQPVIQQPIRTYPSPIYQSPVYQPPVYRTPVFPNRGGVIPQQPLPGTPVYRAPAGQIQTVPPVALRRPQSNQPATQPAPQPAIDAEQAAYNAEKLVLVEKLLEKYKATAAENQTALESLKRENDTLVKRTGELSQASTSYQAEVLSLREKLSAAEQASPAAMRQTEQQEAKYQAAVKQLQELESKSQQLAGKNESYLGQIASLKAAQEQAMNSIPAENNQAELTQQNQQLTTVNQTLEQRNQQLSQEFSNLEGRYQNLSAQQRQALSNNQTLSDQIAELKKGDNSFNPDSVSDVAAINAGKTDLAKTTPATQPPVNVATYETEISELTRKNRQLSDSNTKFEKRNRTLSSQLASLKDQSGKVALDENTSAIASTSLPAVLPTVTSATSSGRGWGVLAWLIPFLAIGLGIAFFVIIKEELHRPPVGVQKRSRPAKED